VLPEAFNNMRGKAHILTAKAEIFGKNGQKCANNFVFKVLKI
jgi:hypothetical protein